MRWGRDFSIHAVVAQLVEHFHGKEKVTGSNPVNGSTLRPSDYGWQAISLCREGLALRSPEGVGG